MEEKVYNGLTNAEVEKRIKEGQVNISDNHISKTTAQIVRCHTLTYFNFLNLFLGVLVIISGQFKNLTFLGVILCNSVIGIIQEIKVKKLIDNLAVITASKARACRSGVFKDIPIEELVLDDLIAVENGNQIGADCEVLESDGIEVNESMITGESKSVRKKVGDTLWSGSFMVAGSGKAKVIHVGKDNYATQLADQAKDKKRASSEMQDSIKKIIKITGTIIIPVGILLFISQRGAEGTSFSNALVSTVAGVIGMIPEGLVLLTSVSFILGVGRLAKKQALVQEMEAIEALARVNVLCLDKTGTITTGALEVVELVPFEEDVQRMTVVMNEISFAFDDVNATQDALMSYFKKATDWKIKDKIPFSSERKYRAISFEGEGDYVLGAPEFLVKDNEALSEKVDAYSRDGMRVLLLGKCSALNMDDMSVGTVTPSGLIVISDCIRPEAHDTFAYFASQNVNIKVISGDNPVTVSNIAVKAGLVGGEKYIDANTLPEDFEELREVVPNYTVYGRVRPEQKQRLIKAYQANGNVVGMVGDGVNDVLALKDANCGIAMAAGSDAAKQVAHIVLMDSNFASMVSIVREGRMIISNIERVSALYLTKTIYSVLLCVIFIILGRSYPFVPIHLSLISTTAIGIPSFILTLEQTEAVTSNGFLRNVLRISLPSALTMVIMMLINQVAAGFFGFDAVMLSTYNMLVAGFISQMVVLEVCRPMNKRRRLLCAGVAAIFVAGIFFFPGFFSISNILNWRLIFILPLMILSRYLMGWLTKSVRILTKQN
ncbi:MAG: HAD family hydrolase [Clostridia bacterium]|nr:HAD family hydrolase [Clostridia bacterium]NCD01952.1 HAD family hydrolase [Clostridia bacterium]